jgi:hypothetical protein
MRPPRRGKNRHTSIGHRQHVERHRSPEQKEPGLAPIPHHGQAAGNRQQEPGALPPTLGHAELPRLQEIRGGDRRIAGSRMRREAGYRSLALDGASRIWPVCELKTVPVDNPVIGKPQERHGHGQCRKTQGGGPSHRAPSRDRQDQACKHAGKEPAVVACQAGTRQARAALPQRPSRLRFSALLLSGGKEFTDVHNRPDEPRQVQRLGHGRGLQIEQVRIQAVDARRQPGGSPQARVRAPQGFEPATHQAEDPDHPQHVGDHRGNGTARARLPRPARGQERHHQQMRQGQPNRPQLQEARSPRVEDTPRNVDMGDGIAIEQDVAAAKIQEEGDDR